MRLSILVCTVVHNPQDARILHRQIRAILDAGHAVTYAAPFSAYGVEPWPEVTPIDLPRAVGRKRLGALRAARKLLRRQGREADLVLLHDPELLLAAIGAGRTDAVVWDVHEDTPAAIEAKPWLPAPLRPLARGFVRGLERFAEGRFRLLLAEAGYRTRFKGVHPVVLNTTYVPDKVVPPGDERAVYVGHLTAARGVDTLVEAARLLQGSGLSIDLVGAADAYAKRVLRAAQQDGLLTWHGFLPNNEAMSLVDGAMCGFSLLRDLPNYRHSMPTKVLEYMGRGIPVITTPLPAAVTMTKVHRCGVVVPFDDAKAVAEAVRRLQDEPELRVSMGEHGHQAARASYHWPDSAHDFVMRLESWAVTTRATSHPSLGTT